MKQKTKNRSILLSIILMVFIFNACEQTQIKITDFETRFISNIDNKPIFSWKTESDSPDFLQSDVQIIIADNLEDINNNKGNIWDSGKTTTTTNSNFKYSGTELQRGGLYFARVKLWNDADNASNWSEVSRFYVPIDYPQDWEAKWITYDYHPDSALPVFKKVLDVENKKDIESARLYIAAPGFYEAFLNGKKIGKNVLDPGQTNYEDYTYYTAYDLDFAEKNTKDVLGVMLGNGWYNQNVVWGKEMIYGQPVFMAQLIIRYKNGITKIIGTDESWKWKKGPITFSNIYAGESYNANLEINDWFSAESAEESWQKALKVDDHQTNLLEQFANPIQKMDSIQPKGIITKADGKYVFDFGQNFAGWVKLKIKGEKGQEITLRCVEELDENGDIVPRTAGSGATKVIQTQKYICKGEGLEVWEPKFTYFGFRYVEVEGLSKRPSNDLLTGIVVYSSLPKTGQFSCSEENINKLHELAEWTLKSNIHGIPTDCPHREKCGWTGDAHALAQALMYNFDAQQFISKYIFDMRSSGRERTEISSFRTSFYDRAIVDKPAGIPTMIVPGRRTSGMASPDWGSAMTQLPWYLYLYYGDTIVLRNFYPDMKVWVDYVQANNEDGIITLGLGDWCPPGGNKNMECPVPVSSTAFHILDLKLLAQTAAILGMNKDAEYYNQLHQKTVANFNQHFLDKENFTYGSQTADAMALENGIVPEEIKAKVAASIVKNIHEKHNGFISTGIFGISRIFKVLADNGFEDEVYRLLSKKGENSFAFMWDNYDATTLWEILPVYTIVGNEIKFCSRSHPMQAGYDSWFYSGIAGINPSADEPGFKKIVFKPHLTKYLKNAAASYESPFGTIKSDWKNEAGQFSWEISIPENSRGEVFVPNFKKPVELSINGKIIQFENTPSDFTSIGEFGSGNYSITIKQD